MRVCAAGHYFDPAFYHRCPSCGIAGLDRTARGEMAAAPPATEVGGHSDHPSTAPAAEPPTPPSEVTRAPAASRIASEPTRLFGPPGEATLRSEPTVVFWPRLARPGADAEREGHFSPVVGWLVAIAGPTRGEAYPLRPEGNPIGRAPDCSVVLPDPAISGRDPHATLYFDPAAESPSYYLQPGGRHMVYVNGTPVFSASVLESHDVLTLGSTRLLFVPLCDQRFRWDSDTQAERGERP